ncbi:MAG: serine aminopeptidase domain-containing protein [Coriobacteriales bacterium]|jgi:alpha-beta hydrolase superfamily lysophospholipase
MQQTIVRDPVRFTSHDGTSEIHGCIWYDPANVTPTGIVQIAHGMAEYIGRYDDFARWLVRQGFVVAGHDHIGHGNSVSSPEQWGRIPASNGKHVLIEDLHTMRSVVGGHYPSNVPYFMFGHSLGSYILRSYITTHGEGLSGAIICGTGHVEPAVSKAGVLLARAIALKDGEDSVSTLLDDMSVGGYAKAVPDARTPFDWLSHNTDNVDAYIADERCGFKFSVGAMSVVAQITGEVCSFKSANRIPKSLPLLYIAGDEDPVGSQGAGVRKACEMAQRAGVLDTELKLYRGMRHEILNETGHEAVYEDVNAWLKDHARRRPSSKHS